MERWMSEHKKRKWKRGTDRQTDMPAFRDQWDRVWRRGYLFHRLRSWPTQSSCRSSQWQRWHSGGLLWSPSSEPHARDAERGRQREIRDVNREKVQMLSKKGVCMFVCVFCEGHLGSCGTGQGVESLLQNDIMPEQSQPGVILGRCRNQPGEQAVQEG